MTKPYQPIDVQWARKIAHECEKDIVLIAAWDQAHEKTHVTTYGRTPEMKLLAANLGAQVAKTLGLDAAREEKYEDFRLVENAQWAQEMDGLLMIIGRFVKAATAADHVLSSLLAVRDGATDELLSEVQAELREVLGMAREAGKS